MCIRDRSCVGLDPTERVGLDGHTGRCPAPREHRAAQGRAVRMVQHGIERGQAMDSDPKPATIDGRPTRRSRAPPTW
eukprot:13121408-Alexandrium_andersonii.AAC.1